MVDIPRVAKLTPLTQKMLRKGKKAKKDRNPCVRPICMLNRPTVPTNDSRFQVYHNCSGDMLAGSGLAEEGIEGVVSAPDRLVAGHLTIGLDAVLQAIQLPACIAHLHTCLPDMDTNTLTLLYNREGETLLV